MKIFVGILAILLGLFLFLTRDYNMTTDVKSYIIYPKPKYPTSKMQLDIKLNTIKLAKELSELLPMEYQLTHQDIDKYNNQDTKYKWLNATITRLGTPEIMVEDNLLLLKAEIKITGKLNYKHCTDIPFSKKPYCIDVDSDFSTIADISTKIDMGISSNWHLKVKNIRDLSIYIKEAHAWVYGVDIPIASILNYIIKKHSKELIPTIRENIEKISIKKQMQQVWDKMHLNQKMPNEDIWFDFIPKDISFTSSYANNNTMILHPKIIGEAKVITNKKEYNHKNLPLPNLKMSDPDDNNFSIKIPVELEYDKLSKIIIEKIKDKNIEKSGFKILIQDIKFYSNGNNISIEVYFDTQYKWHILNSSGIMTLRGRPTYDSQTYKLSIKDLEYSIDTDKSFVSLGSLIWYDYFKTELEKLLVYDISKKNAIFKRYKHLINQEVISMKLNDDIEVNGKLHHLGLDNIYLGESNIVITLHIAGELNFSIKD